MGTLRGNVIVCFLSPLGSALNLFSFFQAHFIQRTGERRKKKHSAYEGNTFGVVIRFPMISDDARDLRTGKALVPEIFHKKKAFWIFKKKSMAVEETFVYLRATSGDVGQYFRSCHGFLQFPTLKNLTKIKKSIKRARNKSTKKSSNQEINGSIQFSNF